MTTDHKRSVSAVDSLWLHMDTPENLMVIEGVMMFEGELDIERSIEVLRRRLPKRYPVFRDIPVPSRSPMGGDYWVPAKDFDIHDHVVMAELEAPGDDAALQAYVGREMSKPLDRSKPLWQIHFIAGYEGGTAMLARFHHSMADGTALARVLLELTDDDQDGDLREAEELKKPGVENVGPSHSVVGVGHWVADRLGGEPAGKRHQIGNSADSAAGSVAGTVKGAAQGSLNVLGKVANPQRVNDAISLARTAPTLLNKLFVSQLPQSPIRGKAGVEKVAAWSRPHDLAKVKAAGQAHGATINDVMISCLAGAMRTYTLEHGGVAEEIATMVPVNLRRLDRPLPRELGNKFALVVLKLPLDGDSAQARLAETKVGMDEIKNSSEALITFGVIEGLGAISASVTQHMVSFFSGKAIGVTTNVPGPGNARYFAGVRVTSVLGWAPSAGDQTLNACIFSCDGQIRVGFKADAASVPDAHSLVAAFDAELAELERSHD